MDDDLRKDELKEPDYWRNSSGVLHQLCVPCELSSSKESVQASVVYAGMSLCLDHLHFAIRLRKQGHSDGYISRRLVANSSERV